MILLQVVVTEKVVEALLLLPRVGIVSHDGR